MPLDALGLALAAAALHALWNVLLARAPDIEGATAAALPVATIAFAPVAAATWRVASGAWPFVAGSSALELGYFVLLVAAYRREDLSVVYPVARGLGPVFVLAASAAFLGAGSSPAESTGVALVASGILLVRGLSGGVRTAGLTLAVGVACFIAAYTLVDRYGVRHANPLSYLEVVFVGPALCYPLAVGMARARRALDASVVLAALSMFGAYALVLAALRLASAASVAAVRESSVVIAVALAAILLRERVGPGRAAGAALVAAGVGLVASS